MKMREEKKHRKILTLLKIKIEDNFSVCVEKIYFSLPVLLYQYEKHHHLIRSCASLSLFYLIIVFFSTKKKKYKVEIFLVFFLEIFIFNKDIRIKLRMKNFYVHCFVYVTCIYIHTHAHNWKENKFKKKDGKMMMRWETSSNHQPNLWRLQQVHTYTYTEWIKNSHLIMFFKS